MQTARLEFRVDTELKELIEQAARFLGVTQTAFASAALAERAQEVIRDHTTLRLSSRDWDAFLAALDSPPEPNPRLRRAFKKHRRGAGR